MMELEESEYGVIRSRGRDHRFWAVVVGNLTEGFRLVGPFKTSTNAAFWAKDYAGIHWDLVRFISPEDWEEYKKEQEQAEIEADYR